MNKIFNFLKKYEILLSVIVWIFLFAVLFFLVQEMIPLIPSLDPEVLASSPEMRLALYYFAYIVVVVTMAHISADLLIKVFKLISRVASGRS